MLRYSFDTFSILFFHSLSVCFCHFLGLPNRTTNPNVPKHSHNASGISQRVPWGCRDCPTNSTLRRTHVVSKTAYTCESFLVDFSLHPLSVVYIACDGESGPVHQTMSTGRNRVPCNAKRSTHEVLAFTFSVFHCQFAFARQSMAGRDPRLRACFQKRHRKARKSGTPSKVANARRSF